MKVIQSSSSSENDSNKSYYDVSMNNNDKMVVAPYKRSVYCI